MISFIMWTVYIVGSSEITNTVEDYENQAKQHIDAAKRHENSENMKLQQINMK